MNAFTGGCHYDLGCGRYLQACGECPQLDLPGPTDLSYQIWERKKELFERLSPDKIHFVAPSAWLADQAKQSPVLGRFPLSVIPYGLDLDDFAPRDKFSAREVFGIPHEAKVVLFVADGLSLMQKVLKIGCSPRAHQGPTSTSLLGGRWTQQSQNYGRECPISTSARSRMIVYSPISIAQQISSRFLPSRTICPTRFLNRWPVERRQSGSP